MLPKNQSASANPLIEDFFNLKKSEFLSLYRDVSKDDYNAMLISEFAKRQHEGKFYPCPCCGSASTMRYCLEDNSFNSTWNIFICPVCGTANDEGNSDSSHWDIVERPFRFFREFAQF